MVTFKRDHTVYLANDNKRESEFIFRRGYSYPFILSSKGITVGNNLRFDIVVKFKKDEIEKYVEVI